MLYDRENVKGYKKVTSLDEHLREVETWIPFGGISKHVNGKYKSKVYQFNLIHNGKRTSIKRGINI